MNYTYAQMKEMQEQAFERVREMRQRADLTAKQAMQDIGGAETADVAPEKQPESVTKIPDEPKRYSMPVEFGERRSGLSFPTGGSTGVMPASDSPEDREKALILTLIMLLNAENADRELLFALTYILNG